MNKFNADSENCIVVMYPTGGYGNFIYYLLSEHLNSTVKISKVDWDFQYGNSHSYHKHTESFMLGFVAEYGNLRNFSYNYQITNTLAADQISQGKQFVVLADVGNKGDNVKFLRRYFPNAKVVRVFAETFMEKLILWTNCMTKSNSQNRDNLYPGSVMHTQGIATWANKSAHDVTDSDAIDCMIDFFQRDFNIYGKMFASPVPGVINIPIKSFFNKENLVSELHSVAKQLNTECVETTVLDQIVSKFISEQVPLSLLSMGDTFPLVRQALLKYGYTY